MKQEDFEFTKDELILLANVQYAALKEESKIDEFSQIHTKSVIDYFSSKEKQEVNRKELLVHKDTWVIRWQKTSWDYLGISTKPYTKEVLDKKIEEFNKKVSYDKKVIFALECASFSAYYPLDKDENKFDFSEKEYLNQLDEIFINMNLPSGALSGLRNNYNSYLKKVSNELKTTFQKYSTVIATVGGIAIIALLTPMIAGVVGGLMGLSGAAASSAGLALLGGGSLAAGGLGMAGGTFVLLGGGALAGYVGGQALSNEDIKELKNENLVISSAKFK